ncbi:unnamed protein product [Trichobilharzia szidati]|nr:unnamed protein product [Trichobilharzia szidati]
MLQDVVITKLFLPERRGNLLLTNIQQEPTSEGSPSQILSVPVTEISEPTQSNSQTRLTRSQSVTCSPPYFTSSEHITLPGNTFYTRSRVSQQPISRTLSGHVNESNGLVTGSSLPAVTSVNDSTPLIVPSTIPPRTPHDLATSSAANRIDEQIMNSDSTNDNLLWGRISRNSSGDLRFPGINCTFKSANSVLRQIYQSAMAQDSLTLQLPASAIQCENEANIRLENSLPNSLLNSISRKGFYTCLCCRSTFTSSALYEDHLDRTVARILYRCHLCRASWTTTSREAVSIADVNTSHHHRPEDNSRNPSESTSSSVVAAGSSHEVTLAMIPTTTTNNNNNNHESEISSRFYSVLPGGIISANNKCAIFTHLTSVHPDKRSDWILRPSLLTICPLVTPATYLNLAALTASTTTTTTTTTTTDIQPSDAGIWLLGGMKMLKFLIVMIRRR